MTVTPVPCRPREADALRDLLANVERANREAQIAFSMFCRAHDVPDEAVLDAVTADGQVLVKLPGETAP